MGKIIAICSGKGGVGKTVIAANLARTIAQATHEREPIRDRTATRVVLVDLDLHVHGLTYLLAPDVGDAETDYASLSSALAEEGGGPYTRIWTSVDGGSVDLISSLSGVEDEPATTDARIAAVSSLLRDLASVYDFVIADTRAGPDAFSVAIAAVAHQVLLVMEDDRVSWRATLNFYSELSKVRNPSTDEGLANVFFLLNKVQSFRTVDSERALSRFDFLPVIPYEARVAAYFGEVPFIVERFPHSAFSRRILRVAKFLTGRTDLSAVRRARHPMFLIADVVRANLSGRRGVGVLTGVYLIVAGAAAAWTRLGPYYADPWLAASAAALGAGVLVLVSSLSLRY